MPLMPTLVQTAAGNSADPNPTLTLPSRVTAGNLLVACYLEHRGTVPQPLFPGDSVGNTWQIGSGDVVGGNAPVCAGIFFAWNCKGGADILTLPTTTPSVYSCCEFAGVLATSNPFDDCASASQFGTSLTLTDALAFPSELVFGCLLSPVSTTFTLPAGVTPCATQQSANGSLQAGWGVSPNKASNGTVTFPIGTAAYTLGYYASFQHS